jgi:hypothetical protein
MLAYREQRYAEFAEEAVIQETVRALRKKEYAASNIVPPNNIQAVGLPTDSRYDHRPDLYYYKRYAERKPFSLTVHFPRN